MQAAEKGGRIEMRRLKKLPKKFPEFKSYEEEAEFWDTHDLSDIIKYGEPVEIKFTNKPKSEDSITIRVQQDLKESMEKIARDKGLSVSTLARMWFIEKLREHAKRPR